MVVVDWSMEEVTMVANDCAVVMDVVVVVIEVVVVRVVVEVVVEGTVHPQEE